MRTIVIPDLHAPYHDKKAWKCFLKAAKATKPKNVVIIGDFADCYAVSQHPKTPGRKANFDWEVAEVNKCLDQVEAIGADRIVYCGGNHEYRMDRYIRDVAPALHGMKGTTSKEQYRIKERGFQWVDYMSYIRIGKVAYTHEIGRCGVNTARATLMDFGGNIVVGHSHRGGLAYQGTVHDGGRVCMNVGHMADLKGIDYFHKARAERDWETGFGTVDQDSRGIGWMNFIPIIYNRCVLDGKVYQA